MDAEMKKYFDVAESVYNNIHFKNQSGFVAQTYL